MKIIRNFFNKIISPFVRRIFLDEINLSLFLLFALSLIIFPISIIFNSYQSDSFIEGLVVSSHTILFDLIVFGVFAKVLSKIATRKQKIQRYHNEIDDFRDWSDELAARRIRGNIYRLNKMGIIELDIHSCFLSELSLTSIKLDNSKAFNVNFENSDLDGSKIVSSDLWNSNFKNGSLRNVEFRDSVLNSAKFVDADLYCATMINVSLKNADFENANLNGITIINVDLREARNLNASQLTAAKVIEHSKLIPELAEKF